MKLKYYLRGLGIGIAVTAMILALSPHNAKTMSDEEVIERAKELGMVEAGINEQSDEEKAEQANEPDKTTEQSDEQKPEETNKDVTSEGSEKEQNDEETQKDETAQKDEETQNEATAQNDEVTQKDENVQKDEADVKQSDNNETPDTELQNDNKQNTNPIVITINSGDGSDTVARKLQDAGVVADAKAFDRFLCQNGYDKRLCTGDHTIPAGADEATIAGILTNRQ